MPPSPVMAEHADEDGAADFSASRATMRMRPKSASAVVGLRMLPRPTRVSGSRDDQAGVLKADEGDEEADAAGHGGVELVGNGAQDHLADAGGGEARKMMPERKTAPSAVCQGMCILMQTV